VNRFAQKVRSFSAGWNS